MKKILIVYNPEKQKAKILAYKIKKLFNKSGAKVNITDLTSKLVKSDLCIVLGGDGSILKVGRKLAHLEVPVLGVNLGSLGFLAEFSYDDLVEFIPYILKSEYKIEKRLMLDIVLKKVNGKKYHSIAVNDCIIHIGHLLRIGSFRASIDDSFLAEYIGDGLIISTPTGSTAYSMAAQGPIVIPTLSVIIITPICPHTLTQRPIIVSSESEINICITDYRLSYARKGHRCVSTILSIDGQERYNLDIGDEINIKKSGIEFLTIPNQKQNCFKILQNKLNWGKR